MAYAADSTPASGGQFALTVADLNITVNHEPRIEDVRLAEALGFSRPVDIRELIERHRAALGRLGEVIRTVRKTSGKGGRPGRTTWLNKRQALYLCTKSETPRATETTIAMVEVFDAHLAGTLARPVAVEGHRRALPKPRAPRPPVLSAPAPRLDHDGFALMRLGGEVLVVDLGRIEPGRDGRAVAIGWDARVSVEPLDEARSNARFLGDRSVTLPDPTAKSGRRSVWIVGGVVATQPAATPGDVARDQAPRRPRAAPKRTLAPERRPPLPTGLLPDLAEIEVCGAA